MADEAIEELAAYLKEAAQHAKRSLESLRDMARERPGEVARQHATAREAFAPLSDGQRFRTASPQQIAHGWEAALTWKDTDAMAGVAAQRMAGNIRDRFGLTVDVPGRALSDRDADAIRDAMDSTRARQAEAVRAREAAAAERDDVREVRADLHAHDGERPTATREDRGPEPASGSSTLEDPVTDATLAKEVRESQSADFRADRASMDAQRARTAEQGAGHRQGAGTPGQAPAARAAGPGFPRSTRDALRAAQQRPAADRAPATTPVRTRARTQSAGRER